MAGTNSQAAHHGEQVWPLCHVFEFRGASHQELGKYVLVQGLGGFQDDHDISLVLWIHGTYLLSHVVGDGNSWSSLLFVVCQDHLWNHQGRLSVL